MKTYTTETCSLKSQDGPAGPEAAFCRSFADWEELKAHLKATYNLEDVAIHFRTEFVRSETIDCFDRIEVREVSASEVLLSLSIGLRVCLDVHLFRAPGPSGQGRAWPPKDEYRSILMTAKAVFSRTVRDRVVDLMSARGRIGVVSFFLDAEGRVESASSGARDFFDAHFPSSKRVDDFFPQAHWEYLQGAIRLRDSLTAGRSSEESLVFCFRQESGTVHCLLQRMGASGYLLSLARGR